MKPQPARRGASGGRRRRPGARRRTTRYALALLRAHKADDARAGARRGAAASTRGDQDAHYLAAKLAAMSKDVDGQEKHLRAIQAAGGDGYTRRDGARRAGRGAHDKAAMRAALEAAHRFDPTQADPLRAARTTSRPTTSATPTRWPPCASSRRSTSTTGSAWRLLARQAGRGARRGTRRAGSASPPSTSTSRATACTSTTRGRSRRRATTTRPRSSSRARSFARPSPRRRPRRTRSSRGSARPRRRRRGAVAPRRGAEARPEERAGKGPEALIPAHDTSSPSRRVPKTGFE